MIASVTLLLVWIGLGVPAAAIALPWTALTRNERFLYWIGLRVMRLGLRAAGVRAVVQGRDLVPLNTACIYMANHQSNLDPPLLAGLQPVHAAMMMKQSLMRIPIFGTALRLAHCIPVERSGSVESARQSVRAAAEVLRTGLSITIFPEGTRSPDGQLLPFKKGPFFIAMQTGVPVVPVTISGTGAMLRKGTQWLRPGTAQVTFHAAIDPGSFRSRDELLNAVRAVIASALPATAS